MAEARAVAFEDLLIKKDENHDKEYGIEETVQVTDAVRNFHGLAMKVWTDSKAVRIALPNGKNVILSSEPHWGGLYETIEIYAHPKHAQELRERIDDPEYISEEEFWADDKNV